MDEALQAIASLMLHGKSEQEKFEIIFQVVAEGFRDQALEFDAMIKMVGISNGEKAKLLHGAMSHALGMLEAQILRGGKPIDPSSTIEAAVEQTRNLHIKTGQEHIFSHMDNPDEGCGPANFLPKESITSFTKKN